MVFQFCTLKSNKICSFQIKRKLKAVIRGNEGHMVSSNVPLNVSKTMITKS